MREGLHVECKLSERGREKKEAEIYSIMDRARGCHDESPKGLPFKSWVWELGNHL